MRSHAIRLFLLTTLLLHISTAQPLPLLQSFSTNANKVTTDGTYLITAHIDISVWNNNVDVGTKLRDIVTEYTEPIIAMSAFSGSLYTVTSNGPKSIRKWNYGTGAEVWSRRASFGSNSHDDIITDLVAASAGAYTSSADGTIKLWRSSDGAGSVVQVPTGPSGFVAPVLKLFLDRATNKLYASFGQNKALNGIGRATLLPDGDFEGLTTLNFFKSTGRLGMSHTDDA